MVFTESELSQPDLHLQGLPTGVLHVVLIDWTASGRRAWRT